MIYCTILIIYSIEFCASQQAFADQIVRDSEMVCVELVAKDRYGKFQGVIFLGSVPYDVLKRVYDARVNINLLQVFLKITEYMNDFLC